MKNVAGSPAMILNIIPPIILMKGSERMNVSKKLINYNYDVGRMNGTKIKAITVHHTGAVVGKLTQLYDLFNNPTRRGSAHYGVLGKDVIQLVDEKNTAWTNSNYQSNCESVTIETCNSKSAPNWEVTETTFTTLCELILDIAKRNKLLPLVRGVNLTWHSMFAATSCPGNYLLSRIDDIIKYVNSKAKTNPDVSLDNVGEPQIYRVRLSWQHTESQIGAFFVLDNAIKFAKMQDKTYYVFNNAGTTVWKP